MSLSITFSVICVFSSVRPVLSNNIQLLTIEALDMM